MLLVEYRPTGRDIPTDENDSDESSHRISELLVELIEQGPAEPIGAIERGEATTDRSMIPTHAVLIEQQDRFAIGPEPRRQARRLDLHEREQTERFWLVRHETDEDAPEPERVVTRARDVSSRRPRSRSSPR